MKLKQIAGFLAAALLFVVVGSSKQTVADSTADLMNLEDFTAESLWNFDNTEISYPSEDFVGIVNVSGTIQDVGSSDIFTTVEYDHQGILNFIDDMIYDDNNVGLFLNIDSPGGYTYQIVELYDKLVSYKEFTGRPIYAYCNSYCCSGGYYIAATAEEIYANSESIVGSIGCIMSSYDCSGLYEKLGIKEVNIASGKNKAMGSVGTAMTDEQLAIYQSIVDESYESFVDAVSIGRNMTKDEVYAVADGRIYTAKQALKNGLIDGISNFENFSVKLGEIFGDVEYYTFGEDNQTIYSLLFQKIEKVMPKSDVQTNLELMDEYKNGGLMYYADLD